MLRPFSGGCSVLVVPDGDDGDDRTGPFVEHLIEQGSVSLGAHTGAFQFLSLHHEPLRSAGLCGESGSALASVFCASVRSVDLFECLLDVSDVGGGDSAAFALQLVRCRVGVLATVAGCKWMSRCGRVCSSCATKPSVKEAVGEQCLVLSERFSPESGFDTSICWDLLLGLSRTSPRAGESVPFDGFRSVNRAFADRNAAVLASGGSWPEFWHSFVGPCVSEFLARAVFDFNCRLVLDRVGVPGEYFPFSPFPSEMWFRVRTSAGLRIGGGDQRVEVDVDVKLYNHSVVVISEAIPSFGSCSSKTTAALSPAAEDGDDGDESPFFRLDLGL